MPISSYPPPRAIERLNQPAGKTCGLLREIFANAGFFAYEQEYVFARNGVLVRAVDELAEPGTAIRATAACTTMPISWRRRAGRSPAAPRCRRISAGAIMAMSACCRAPLRSPLRLDAMAGTASGRSRRGAPRSDLKRNGAATTGA